MIKDDIKMQIKLIFILFIFLIVPYKRYINERVYDPNANYQVLKKINRSKIEMRDNTLIFYKKNSEIDFYSNSTEQIYIKNLDKIIYLETYKNFYEINEDGYFSYIFFIKNNKTFYFRPIQLQEIDIRYLRYIADSHIFDSYHKKVKPLVPYFQTPKEFYENFKEYFFPYYLEEYEVK